MFSIFQKKNCCHICSKALDDPKQLECDHKFCSKCLKSEREKSPGWILKCPKCEVETKVPECGISGLPDAHLDKKDRRKSVKGPKNATPPALPPRLAPRMNFLKVYESRDKIKNKMTDCEKKKDELVHNFQSREEELNSVLDEVQKRKQRLIALITNIASEEEQKIRDSQEKNHRSFNDFLEPIDEKIKELEDEDQSLVSLLQNQDEESYQEYQKHWPDFEERMELYADIISFQTAEFNPCQEGSILESMKQMFGFVSVETLTFDDFGDIVDSDESEKFDDIPSNGSYVQASAPTNTLNNSNLEAQMRYNPDDSKPKVLISPPNKSIKSGSRSVESQKRNTPKNSPLGVRHSPKPIITGMNCSNHSSPSISPRDSPKVLPKQKTPPISPKPPYRVSNQKQQRPLSIQDELHQHPYFQKQPPPQN